MIRKIIFILISLIFSNFSFAQEKRKEKTDSLYVKDYSHKLTVFTYGKTKYVQVLFANKKTNEKIGFSPNNRFNVGFGFTYKWLGLGIAFNLPFINNDNDLKGKTSRFDAQMNMFMQKFVFDLYFSHYKGFYVTTPTVLDTSWVEGMPYPQYPALQSTNLGFSTYYILNNKKFSYKAAYALNQIQRKSAGSWIFGFVFNINGVRNDTTLIPETIWDADSARFKVKAITDVSIGPLAGYAYNFVIKKHFLFNISLVPGILIEASEYNYYKNSILKTASSSSFGIGVNYRMGLVYNKGNVFFGLNFNNFATSYTIRGMTKNSSTGNYRLFFGYRFDMNKNKKHKQKL